MRQLSSLGMDSLIEDLPGWGSLFYLGSGHVVLPIHKSINDWQRNVNLSGQWAVDEAAGHSILGINLLKEVTKAADKGKDGAPAVAASKYALKYAVLHITKALSGGRLDLSLLRPWQLALPPPGVSIRPWWKASGGLGRVPLFVLISSGDLIHSSLPICPGCPLLLSSLLQRLGEESRCDGRVGSVFSNSKHQGK